MDYSEETSATAQPAARDIAALRLSVPSSIMTQSSKGSVLQTGRRHYREHTKNCSKVHHWEIQLVLNPLPQAASRNSSVNRLNLSTLRKRHQQLRLELFYEVVEELVQAMQTSKFLTFQKPRRLLRLQSNNIDFSTASPGENYVRNSDRVVSNVSHCRTDQYTTSSSEPQ